MASKKHSKPCCGAHNDSAQPFLMKNVKVAAEQASISRETLYRCVSLKGNPTLKTQLVVLKSVGVRLLVGSENPAQV